MPFQPLYTGRGIATEFPKDTGRSTERLSDFIIRAEELKYQTFRQNEQEFLKNANIDPAFFINKAIREEQTRKIEKFNNDWSQRMKTSGYNLSPEDKLQMQSERGLLEAWQNSELAQQKMWQEHNALASSNPNLVSREKMDARTVEYFKTGNYPYPTVPLKSKNPILFLKSQSIKLNREKIPYGNPVKDEFGNLVYQYSSIPEEDIPTFIENIFMDDPQAMEGMVDDFKKDNSPEKWAMLTDANEDGRITNENADDNVIMLWAKQNKEYQDAVRQVKANAPKTVPQPRTATMGLLSLNMFGKTTKYAPTEASATKLGETVYDTYHTFDNVPVGDIPLGTPIRILNPEGEETITPNNTVTVDLTGYDENKDEFTFIVTKNFNELYSGISILESGKDYRIAVKRKDLPPKYSNLSILKNGRTIRIGDLGGTQTQISKKPAY